jgi:hypothetical protein
MEAPQTRAGRRGLRLGSSRLGTACLKSMMQELHIGARVTNRAVERQSDYENELKPLRVLGFRLHVSAMPSVCCSLLKASFSRMVCTDGLYSSHEQVRFVILLSGAGFWSTIWLLRDSI